MKWKMENLADTKLFLKQGIWDVSLKDLPWMERSIVSALRVLSITFRKYAVDECSLRASALTFFALMSIVPVAAVAFAIAKGFGFQKLLEQRLMEDLAEHQEVVVYVIEFSRRLLDTTKGGLLAGAGIIVLLWSVIKVLDNIEQSFNQIWGVTRQRPLGRKFSDYLSIMLIAPILMIMSGSATLMVIKHLNNITTTLGPGISAFVITSLIKLIPYCPIWLLLAFVYIFIPNTQVRPSSGFVAGLAAGTIFVIVEKIYIFFQVGVAHYNAIYGSFAALPLFLVLLQISWYIVLLGAELSYAYQNAYACGIELDMSRISPVQKKLLCLAITHHVVAGFEAGSHAPTAADISKVLGLPLILVKRIMSELCETGILIEVAPQGNGKSTYIPAKDPATITVASVIETQDDHGVTCAGMPIEDYSKDFEGILKEFSRIIEGSDANRLLKDIPLKKSV